MVISWGLRPKIPPCAALPLDPVPVAGKRIISVDLPLRCLPFWAGSRMAFETRCTYRGLVRLSINRIPRSKYLQRTAHGWQS